MHPSEIQPSTYISADILPATKYGFGMHIRDVELEWWPSYMKVHAPHPHPYQHELTCRQYSYSMTALACASYPLTKISMLAFYARLAPLPMYRKICFATIAVIGISGVFFMLTCLFSCRPMNGGWSHSSGLNTKCLRTRTFSYLYCSFSVIADVILMVLPIPILLRLQLRPKVKYGLVAMFATGTM